MLLRCLIRSRETMHLGKTLRFKKIASDAWHVGAGSAIIEGVCCGSFTSILPCPLSGPQSTIPDMPDAVRSASACRDLAESKCV